MIKSQIRVLCDSCGCYYFWNIEFEHKDYNKAVWQTPADARIFCPECGSQKIAQHAHHSADVFNCGAQHTDRPSRYFSGPGSLFEPILVENKCGIE